MFHFSHYVSNDFQVQILAIEAIQGAHFFCSDSQLLHDAFEEQLMACFALTSRFTLAFCQSFKLYHFLGTFLFKRGPKCHFGHFAPSSNVSSFLVWIAVAFFLLRLFPWLCVSVKGSSLQEEWRQSAVLWFPCQFVVGPHLWAILPEELLAVSWLWLLFWRNCNLLGLNYNNSKILQLPWILLFPLAVFLPLLHLSSASNSSAPLLMNWIKTFTSRSYGVQLCTPFADSRFFPSVYPFHTDCWCHWKSKLNKTGTQLTSSKQAGECWSCVIALRKWNERSPAAMSRSAQMPRKYPESEVSQGGWLWVVFYWA